MAQPEPVAPVEGYRRRDRDGVEFVALDEASDPDTVTSIRVIDAAQMVIVGEVDVNAVERRPDASGEWGRIGPERRMGRQVPPANDPFQGIDDSGPNAKE